MSIGTAILPKLLNEPLLSLRRGIAPHPVRTASRAPHIEVAGYNVFYGHLNVYDPPLFQAIRVQFAMLLAVPLTVIDDGI